MAVTGLFSRENLRLSLSTFASLCLMSRALAGYSRPPHTLVSLISLQLPRLGQDVAVAQVCGTTT